MTTEDYLRHHLGDLLLRLAIISAERDQAQKERDEARAMLRAADGLREGRPA
jgi:hypothetical protein